MRALLELPVLVIFGVIDLAAVVAAANAKKVTRPILYTPTAQPVEFVPPTVIVFSNPFVQSLTPTNFFAIQSSGHSNSYRNMLVASSTSPSIANAYQPSFYPSKNPTQYPIIVPSTISPSTSPTYKISTNPSIQATSHPPLTPSPSTRPSTIIPTPSSTKSLSFLPTSSPTKLLTTVTPSTKSSCFPTILPSLLPKLPSTDVPTSHPFKLVPTINPSLSPTKYSSSLPSFPSTVTPSSQPAKPLPTKSPSQNPLSPTFSPSQSFTPVPSSPLVTIKPSLRCLSPSCSPSSLLPTQSRSNLQSIRPAQGTLSPSSSPTSSLPSLSMKPSQRPLSPSPSSPLSFLPSQSVNPTQRPLSLSSLPSSLQPSQSHSNLPSIKSSQLPVVSSLSPTSLPTRPATNIPTMTSINPMQNLQSLTQSPSILPTQPPTKMPTISFAPSRSTQPTLQPTQRRDSLRSLPPVIATPASAPTYRSTAAPTPVPPSQDVYFHDKNGSMVLNPMIYNIYIGPFSNTTMDIIDYFATYSGYTSNIPPWYSVINSYTQGEGKNVKQPNPPVFKGRWTYLSTTTHLSLSEDFLGSLILPNILRNGLETCSDCIYSFIFYGGYSFSDNGWNNSSGWCGYHNLIGLAPPGGKGFQIKITVMGDPTTTSPPYDACISNGNQPTANHDYAADSIVTTYANLLARIITDPDGLEWSTADGTEIGDLCSFYFGKNGIPQAGYNYNIGPQNKKFLVQFLWKQGVGCVDSVVGKSNSRIPPTPTPVAAPSASPNLGLELTYHNEGGIVADSNGNPVNIFNVYLGEFDVSTKDIVDYFAANISSTSWYNILSDYYAYLDGVGQVYFATDTVFMGSHSLNASSRGLQLSDLDIRNMLLSLSGDWTSRDVYTVIFRGDFNVSINGKYWLRDWCSYHGSFLALPSNNLVKYSVVGDPSTAPEGAGAVCAPVYGRPTANGNLGADSIVTGYAQQLAQTLTDYELFAWYSDATGLEVGSACYGHFGSGFDLTKNNANIVVAGKPFLVQALWRRGVGCSMAKE